MFILPEFQETYTSKVEAGKKFVNNKKICIVGTIRDAEKTVYSCLNSLKIECSKLSCFLYENDSVDNTKSLLEQYKTDQNTFDDFTYISDHIQFLDQNQQNINVPNNRSNLRLKILSYARNICKDFVKNTYADYDYIIVADMDYKFLSINGLYNSFGWISENKSDIDAMAGFSFIKVQRPNPNNPSLTEEHLSNYDSWAYRQNWWEDLSKRFALNKDNPFTMEPMLWFNAWIPLIGAMPIKVNSAFGGCAIYRTDKYLMGQYEDYDCEHVCFHKSINFVTDNFNMYANPSQIMMLN